MRSRALFVCGLGLVLVVVAAVTPAVGDEVAPLSNVATERLLGPPIGDGPTVVRAGFHLQSINEVNDETQTFHFTGVLTLSWNDPRRAFEPAEAGIDEKVYQGRFQFDEASPAWYPQLVLANVSGLNEGSAVLLRVKPDGATTLIQDIDAVAHTRLNLRRFPFDRQRLEAVFHILGFDATEVSLQTTPLTLAASLREVSIPEWRLTEIAISPRDLPAPYAGNGQGTTGFVLGIEAERRPFFVLRLVIIPLLLITCLSWSVFWMERSSLGDRMAVSFVGILSAVAYQVVVGDILPQISYLTFVHSFMSLSFALMCVTVLVNLYVAAKDNAGDTRTGDRVDRSCRWLFPLGYGVLIGLAYLVTFRAGLPPIE